MEIHLIRHATLKVKYGNKMFLIDPWLMMKEEMPGFPIGVNPEVRQPRVDLPISIDEIVNTDAVILTHTHEDHWDDIAGKSINKNLPFFVQNENDANFIKKYGFTDVRIIEEAGTQFEGINLYKTGTQHGPHEIVKPFFDSINVPYDCMGVVFQKQGQKTLYVAGDTIWCDEVKTAIDKFSPSVIVANLGGVSLFIDGKSQNITMDLKDVKEMSSYAKSAKIIVDHMETTSHITFWRDDVKKLNLPNVVVPDDNDIIKV